MIRKKLNTSLHLDTRTNAKPRLALATSAERFAMESLGLPTSGKVRRASFSMLGVDSLDKLKLALDLEAEYDIHLQNEDVAATDSFEEVAELVAVTVK